MSNTQQSFSSGHNNTGQPQLKAEEWMQSTKDTANAARDNTVNDTAQHGKEQTAGFLQQTGDQIASMAQGAADTVKNTLGINNDNTSSTTRK
uniref:Late embryogenesis abundant protein 1-like n=1 Tax=Kalanchoe fedtschenkoi TaxID=63787 RepID=A0A7N0TT82_KALFE